MGLQNYIVFNTLPKTDVTEPLGKQAGSRVVKCLWQEATTLVSAFDDGNAVLTVTLCVIHTHRFNYRPQQP